MDQKPIVEHKKLRFGIIAAAAVMVIGVFVVNGFSFVRDGIGLAETTTTKGLQVEYFNNTSLSGNSLKLASSNVYLDTTGSQRPANGVSPTYFSARWTGMLTAPKTGVYQIYSNSDDGIRVWIGDQQVINSWTQHGNMENSGSVSLVSGQKYDVKVEYYQAWGAAHLDLAWSTTNSSIKKQSVPVSVFSSTVAQSVPTAPTTTPTPTPSPAPTPTPAPSTGGSTASATWQTAWNTKNHETLRSWFNANIKGPASTSGSRGGATITTQAQADALANKTVTSTVNVNGNLTLHDVIMSKAVININGGNVSLSNILIDGQKQPTDYCGFLNISGGNVSLNRVQITGGGDGIRITGSPTVTADYLYIHNPATTPSCNGHHDGIQLMGGSLNVQHGFIDYSGGPSAGQGLLVKADSADIKAFRYNYSFFTGGGNAMTFEPTDKGFPDAIDFSNDLVAKGCSTNLFSIYRTSTSQTAMITKYSVTDSPSGRVIAARNGIACSSL